MGVLYVSNLVVGLDRGLEDPALLARAADAVNGGVEFFLHTHSPLYLERVKAIPKWLDGRPCTTHGPFIGVEATSEPGTASYDHMIASYAYAFETAAQLGSRHMVFHTNQCVIYPESKAEAQRRCKDVIHRLIEMGGRHRITLLIENLGIQKRGVCLFDEAEFLALLEEVPQAECIIDVGHLHVAGWDAQHVLSALGGRITAYHFHNNNGVDDSHCRICDGTFDYDAFMRLYRQYTPNADITLEYGDNHGITLSQIVEDLQYIRQRMNGISQP